MRKRIRRGPQWVASVLALSLFAVAEADDNRVERSITVPPRSATRSARRQPPEGLRAPSNAPQPPPSSTPAPVEETIPTPMGRGGPPPGEYYEEGYEGAYEFEGGYDYAEDCGLNCPRCGGVGCDLWWASAEYLMWWADGMKTPPLVTSSPDGTAGADAGVIGRPNTEILYGGGSILTDMRQGGRFRLGKWLDCGSTGIEFEYLFLGQIRESFTASSAGDPALARPYVNAVTGLEDSQLVGFTGELAGSVTVNANSFVESGGARLLLCLMQNSYCNDDACGHYACGAVRTRWNLLLGYRYMNLNESLEIREDLTSLLDADPNTAGFQTGRFDILDSFRTDNDFHGGEMGLVWNYQQNRWGVNLLGKIALGNNHQRVKIFGETIQTVEGVAASAPGGLLAQTGDPALGGSNIGDYSRDRFSTISEIGGTVKYRVNNRLSLTAGYSMILWANVARPGSQIDRFVDSGLLPFPSATDPPPSTNPLRPRFLFADESFLLHGVNLGAELVW